MKGMRPLSASLPKVTDKVFNRKYIMLGRLVTRWNDIVGDELAAKTQPVKIRYYKKRKKTDKATASLDIATSSADATALHYQKDLIIERLNHIFGDKWITAIRFVPIASNAKKATPNTYRKKLRKKPLGIEEKEYLSSLLNDIEDPEINEKLNSLGKAILQDSST